MDKRTLALSVGLTIDLCYLDVALAENANVAMLNFELSGKWSTDCAVTPEVGGRPVAVV